MSRKRIFNLIGIGSNMIPNHGEVRLMIRGLETAFQISPQDFPVLQDGVIKIIFLTQNRAVINFSNDQLFIYEDCFPLLSHFGQFNVGYVRKKPCGPGILAREALVLNENREANLFIINSTPIKVSLTIPPVTLEEYDVITSLNRSNENLFSTDRQKNVYSRFAKILKFFLEGGQLGATNVFSHKIITRDETPVNTKQYRYPPIHKDEIREQTNKLLNSGIVKPSVSPYNSPL